MGLTVQGGSLVKKDSALGTQQECCCARCSLGDCTATLEFLDENECEDDVFDLYVINPETLAERFVQEIDLVADPAGSCEGLEAAPGATYANITVPLELTLADWSSDCRVTIDLRFKSANCCFTWTRYRIRRPDESLLYGGYFTQSGITSTYTWDDLCGPHDPPPPPRSCCSKIATCDGLDIWACSGSEENCCNDLDPEADCTEVGVMPLTECTFTDQAPAQATAPNQAPFDCLGETHLNYLNGAFVEVDGWSFYDASGSEPGDYDAWFISLINRLTELMNASYFAEWEGCFANADTTYTFSGPTVTIPGDDTYATSFEVTVLLDMCNRSASVQVIEINFGFISAVAAVAPGPRESLTPPCNAYTGCYCSSYTEDIESIYTGTNGSITVGL